MNRSLKYIAMILAGILFGVMLRDEGFVSHPSFDVLFSIGIIAGICLIAWTDYRRQARRLANRKA